ncbi:MAG: diadenylate cyclase CdaA [Oscillospiraceae bacterium]|nr:diadenylate cyclase CdaA [Oscillospiraceae bacterium]
MDIFVTHFGEDGTLHVFFNQALGILRSFNVPDALDIILLTFLFYKLIKLLRDTRAVQLIKGFLLIAVVYGVTVAMGMTASSFFFDRLWGSAIVVLFFVFQPEIRHAVETMGRSGGSGILRLFSGGKTDEQRQKQARRVAIATAKAAGKMSAQKIGALIVFERRTLLGDVAKTGVILEAKLSEKLLGNIFYPKAPLHDGAVIVRGNIIYAAACVLPLTDNHDLPGAYGMRHRAALGISEESDAVVLVVSEETGKISIICDGALQTDLSEAVLREELITALDWENKQKEYGSFAAIWKKFWRKTA